METKHCPTCNAALEDGATFCSACGVSLAGIDDTAQAVQNTPPAAPVGDQPTAAMPQQTVYGGYSAPPPPAPQPQMYAPPVAPAPQVAVRDETVSIGAYIWPQLLHLVPVIGSIAWLIIMIVFAVSSEQKPSYRNYARANLIIFGIGLVLLVLLFSVMGAAFYSVFDYMY